MPYWAYQVLGVAVPLAFVFAFGACLGSLINVIAYRLPLGIGIVTPPSRCPSCDTRLTFRENIPVLGWVMLRGRCRFCSNPVSAEYPIVEAITGLLFALCYVVVYVLPPNAVFLGVEIGEVRPDWATDGFVRTWPIFIIWLVLLGSLVAMTITDLKTYTIPLILTWVPAIVALVAHPVFAAWVGSRGTGLGLRGAFGVGGWSMPIPHPPDLPGVWGLWNGWSGTGVAVGGFLGLIVANAILQLGLIPRSFADYDEWEERAKRDAASAAGDAGGERSSRAEPATAEGDPDMWLEYPHARREMVKELAFLAPIVIGGWLGLQAVGWFGLSGTPDLWLRVLTGAVMGYLVGGGLVWFVRIAGSLAFGREAMGLGDVHVLGAIGACVGWIDAGLTFFAAVLVGLVGAGVMGLLAKDAKAPRMLAFGPCLAIGALVVVVGKPLIEVGLGMLMHRTGPLVLP